MWNNIISQLPSLQTVFSEIKKFFLYGPLYGEKVPFTGKDIDDVFAYKTNKSIAIRDKNVAILSFLSKALTLIFILTYQIGYNNQHMGMSDVDGTASITFHKADLISPTAPYCLESGTPSQPLVQLPCRKPLINDLPFRLSPEAYMIPTRTHSVHSAAKCSFARNDSTPCDQTFQVVSTTPKQFIQGLEEYFLVIKHEFKSQKKNLQSSHRLLQGHWISCKENGRECEPLAIGCVGATCIAKANNANISLFRSLQYQVVTLGNKVYEELYSRVKGYFEKKERERQKEEEQRLKEIEEEKKKIPIEIQRLAAAIANKKEAEESGAEKGADQPVESAEDEQYALGRRLLFDDFSFFSDKEKTEVEEKEPFYMTLYKKFVPKKLGSEETGNKQNVDDDSHLAAESLVNAILEAVKKEKLLSETVRKEEWNNFVLMDLARALTTSPVKENPLIRKTLLDTVAKKVTDDIKDKKSIVSKEQVLETVREELRMLIQSVQSANNRGVRFFPDDSAALQVVFDNMQSGSTESKALRNRERPLNKDKGGEQDDRFPVTVQVEEGDVISLASLFNLANVSLDDLTGKDSSLRSEGGVLTLLITYSNNRPWQSFAPSPIEYTYQVFHERSPSFRISDSDEKTVHFPPHLIKSSIPQLTEKMKSQQQSTTKNERETYYKNGIALQVHIRGEILTFSILNFLIMISTGIALIGSSNMLIIFFLKNFSSQWKDYRDALSDYSQKFYDDKTRKINYNPVSRNEILLYAQKKLKTFNKYMSKLFLLQNFLALKEKTYIHLNEEDEKHLPDQFSYVQRSLAPPKEIGPAPPPKETIGPSLPAGFATRDTGEVRSIDTKGLSRHRREKFDNLMERVELYKKSWENSEEEDFTPNDFEEIGCLEDERELEAARRGIACALSDVRQTISTLTQEISYPYNNWRGALCVCLVEIASLKKHLSMIEATVTKKAKQKKKKTIHEKTTTVIEENSTGLAICFPPSSLDDDLLQQYILCKERIEGLLSPSITYVSGDRSGANGENETSGGIDGDEEGSGRSSVFLSKILSKKKFFGASGLFSDLSSPVYSFYERPTHQNFSIRSQVDKERREIGKIRRNLEIRQILPPETSQEWRDLSFLLSDSYRLAANASYIEYTRSRLQIILDYQKKMNRQKRFRHFFTSFYRTIKDWIVHTRVASHDYALLDDEGEAMEDALRRGGERGDSWMNYFEEKFICHSDSNFDSRIGQIREKNEEKYVSTLHDITIEECTALQIRSSQFYDDYQKEIDKRYLLFEETILKLSEECTSLIKELHRKLSQWKDLYYLSSWTDKKEKTKNKKQETSDEVITSLLEAYDTEFDTLFQSDEKVKAAAVPATNKPRISDRSQEDETPTNPSKKQVKNQRKVLQNAFGAEGLLLKEIENLYSKILFLSAELHTVHLFFQQFENLVSVRLFFFEHASNYQDPQYLSVLTEQFANYISDRKQKLAERLREEKLKAIRKNPSKQHQDHRILLPRVGKKAQPKLFYVTTGRPHHTKAKDDTLDESFQFFYYDSPVNFSCELSSIRQQLQHITNQIQTMKAKQCPSIYQHSVCIIR